MIPSPFQGKYSWTPAPKALRMLPGDTAKLQNLGMLTVALESCLGMPHFPVLAKNPDKAAVRNRSCGPESTSLTLGECSSVPGLPQSIVPTDVDLSVNKGSPNYPMFYFYRPKLRHIKDSL